MSAVSKPVTNVSYVHRNILNNNDENHSKFELEPDLEQTVPQTLHINSLSLSEINVNKLSRYVFPRRDFGPTIDGQVEIPTIQSLKYVTNMSCHKISPELKSIYDELCGRDISFPEISESGMLATKYDIKAQCTLYKKAREKSDYVANLSRSLPKNKAGPDNSTLSGQHLTLDNTGNNLRNQTTIQTNSTDFMLMPLSERLRDFVIECRASNLALYEGLSKMYYLQVDSFVLILKDMIKLAKSKSLKKKYKKFEQFIFTHKKLSNAKFNYFIRLMHRGLSMFWKIRCNYT